MPQAYNLVAKLDRRLPRMGHTWRISHSGQARKGKRCPIKFEKNYLVTRSNHFNIASIVNIERVQAMTKTVHVIQIGMLS